MRVELVENLSTPDPSAAREFSDTAVERGLKNFLVAIGSDDSLFDAKFGAILLSGVDSSVQLCLGTITLKFRDEKLARNRPAHFALLEKLTGLLRDAGSAESLGVQLCLVAGSAETERLDLALALRLEATGTLPEQAGLRWSLGLAHVQQALLFASRSLRQQFTTGAM